MNETCKHIQSFVHDSARLFSENDIEKAVVLLEKAYSIARYCDECPEITKRKIQYNLAVIYASFGEFNQAKDLLDAIKGKSVAFARKNEIANLYALIGNNLLVNLNNLKVIDECYQISSSYHAKSKNWNSFCEVALIHARVLNDFGRYKESYLIANKILSASLFLKDDYELAQIYNDLSTIYARDPLNEANILFSKKLLNKALRYLNGSNKSLEICIYENLSALNNRLSLFSDALKLIDSSFLILNNEDHSQLASDLKYNQGYAKANLMEMTDAIEAFTQSHLFALKTCQKNVWESLEAVGNIYIMIKNYELAQENFEKALKYFELYHNVKKILKDKKILNRLIYKIKKSNSLNTSFEQFENSLQSKLDKQIENIKNNFEFDSISLDKNELSVGKQVDRGIMEKNDNTKDSINDKIVNVLHEGISKVDYKEEITFQKDKSDVASEKLAVIQGDNLNQSKNIPSTDEIEAENEFEENLDEIKKEESPINPTTLDENRATADLDTELTTEEIKNLSTDDLLINKVKLYNNFNNGTVENHPEDAPIYEPINIKKTKICVIQ